MSRSKMSVLGLVCAGVSLLALSGVPAFAAEEPSDPSEIGTMGQVLLGAITSIDGENYQIRDENGATMPYHVSKETILNGSDFKAGDHVIGSVTPEGHVLALTKRFTAKVGA
ncbi:MAG: hypothetical protein OEY91_11755 [Nitrospirota bacterium]|nr:hypothetical protein [Nitrospirota bacterium]